MKINIRGLNKSERLFILSLFSLSEIYRELHRRANEDVEEDEKIDWEDEVLKAHYDKLFRQFPHFFGRKEVK